MDGQGELFDRLLPRISSAGDTALTVELGEAGAPDVSGRVLDLYLRFKNAGLPGMVDLVPAIRSLTVHYDPMATSAAILRQLVEAWGLASAGQASKPSGNFPAEVRAATRCWKIPACYPPDSGADVGEVGARCGLAPRKVTALQACVSCRVLMVGFLPGQPYLGELPPPLQLPRRDTPRASVPAGSIAIARAMCVIYPFESPGGWHIIGRTPVRLFDSERPEPSVQAPGDVVRFKSIGLDEHSE